MALRTPAQLAWRRRIERAIGLAAPALDVLLLAGEQVSRVAGRHQIDPEPPRRLGDGELLAAQRPAAARRLGSSGSGRRPGP